MGRQIQFFMGPNDEKVFFEELAKNEDIIILRNEIKGELIELKEYQQSLKDYKVFITTKNSRVNIESFGYISELESEVIEFVRCKSGQPKQLEMGRLWVELSYWNNDGETIKKPEWLLILFERYSRWIKKNYRISRDKFCYIGEEAYRMNKEEGWKMMGGPVVQIEF